MNDTTILEGRLVITTADGSMPVFFARPQGAAPCPAVILYMDVFGPRDELDDFCRRFADNGYLALLPSLFYRRDRESYPPSNAKGETVDPGAFAAGRETTVEMTVRDSQSLMAEAKKGVFGVAVTGFGTVGYCMGGRHALAAMAASPTDVKTGLSLHGGQLVKRDGFSPHTLIAGLKHPFHFAFAENDKTCPPDHQALIEEEAERAGPHITSKHYAAGHGWSFPARWSYDAAVAEANWQMALDMFAAHIPR